MSHQRLSHAAGSPRGGTDLFHFASRALCLICTREMTPYGAKTVELVLGAAAGAGREVAREPLPSKLLQLLPFEVQYFHLLPSMPVLR